MYYSRILVLLLASAVLPSAYTQESQFLQPQRSRQENPQDAAYQRGQSALDAHRWDEALQAFNQAASSNGSRTDAALYWKAYALGKLGRRGEALNTIAELRKAYASSKWVDDAGALELEMRHASGQAVNPDGIKNQIEGSIIQSMTWSILEEVTWGDRAIESRDWSGYPMLRFPSMPASFDVHVIDRPGAPFLGTGEAGQGPAGAAIANAIAHATGARIRQLPLSPQRVRATLAT